MRFDERYDEFGYECEDADYEEQINEYLTPREVMELLAIGKNTFYKMVQSGQLPAFRIGRQWRVRRVDIGLWADGQIKTQKYYTFSDLDNCFSIFFQFVGAHLPICPSI